MWHLTAIWYPVSKPISHIYIYIHNSFHIILSYIHYHYHYFSLLLLWCLLSLLFFFKYTIINIKNHRYYIVRLTKKNILCHRCPSYPTGPRTCWRNKTGFNADWRPKKWLPKLDGCPLTVEALKLMGSLCRINETFFGPPLKLLVGTWSIWLFVWEKLMIIATVILIRNVIPWWSL